MSGMLDAFRAAADYGRRAVDGIGMRTVAVSIVIDGATLSSTSTTLLSPSPKVKAEGEGESTAFGGGTEAESTGVLKASQYKIGPISRTYSGGGYTQAQLLIAPSSPAQRGYVLLDDGGDQFTSGGEKFIVTSSDASRPLQMNLTVVRSAQ